MLIAVRVAVAVNSISAHISVRDWRALSSGVAEAKGDIGVTGIPEQGAEKRNRHEFLASSGVTSSPS